MIKLKFRSSSSDSKPKYGRYGRLLFEVDRAYGVEHKRSETKYYVKITLEKTSHTLGGNGSDLYKNTKSVRKTESGDYRWNSELGFPLDLPLDVQKFTISIYDQHTLHDDILVGTTTEALPEGLIPMEWKELNLTLDRGGKIVFKVMWKENDLDDGSPRETESLRDSIISTQAVRKDDNDENETFIGRQSMISAVSDNGENSKNENDNDEDEDDNEDVYNGRDRMMTAIEPEDTDNHPQNTDNYPSNRNDEDNQSKSDGEESKEDKNEENNKDNDDSDDEKPNSSRSSRNSEKEKENESDKENDLLNEGKDRNKSKEDDEKSDRDIKKNSDSDSDSNTDHQSKNGEDFSEEDIERIFNELKEEGTFDIVYPTPDLTLKNKKGKLLLREMVESASKDVFRELIECYGDDLLSTREEETGNLAFHIAAETGRVPILLLLMDRYMTEEPEEFKNNQKKTPLDIAKEKYDSNKTWYGSNKQTVTDVDYDLCKKLLIAYKHTVDMRYGMDEEQSCNPLEANANNFLTPHPVMNTRFKAFDFDNIDFEKIKEGLLLFRNKDEGVEFWMKTRSEYFNEDEYEDFWDFDDDFESDLEDIQDSITKKDKNELLENLFVLFMAPEIDRSKTTKVLEQVKSRYFFRLLQSAIVYQREREPRETDDTYILMKKLSGNIKDNQYYIFDTFLSGTTDKNKVSHYLNELKKRKALDNYTLVRVKPDSLLENSPYVYGYDAIYPFGQQFIVLKSSKASFTQLSEEHDIDIEDEDENETDNSLIHFVELEATDVFWDVAKTALDKPKTDITIFMDRLSYDDLGDSKDSLIDFKHRIVDRESRVYNYKSKLAEHKSLVAKYIPELTRATMLYKEALTIQLSITQDREKDTKLATRMGNLAGAYAKQHILGSARSLYEIALEIDRKVYGEKHKSVGVDYNNLAVVYKKMGNKIKAKENYEKAMAIAEEIKDMTMKATILTNLAALNRKQDDTIKAGIEQCQEAINILSQYKSPPPQIVESLCHAQNNLAIASFFYKDKSKAKKAISNGVFKDYRQFYGDNLQVAIAMKNSAHINNTSDTKHFEIADKILKEGLPRRVYWKSIRPINKRR